jgi:hypothetical protein
MFNEESLEIMTIESLKEELKYDHISGENISRDYRDVLLMDILFDSLSTINKGLDREI